MAKSDSPPEVGSGTQRHLWLIASAGAAILLGLVLAFVLGGYLACSPSDSCEFKADLFGAVGTWVGGLGTIGALIFAVIAFRREEESRRHDEQSRIEAEAARRVEKVEERAEEERQRVAQEQERQRAIERDRLIADQVDVGVMINSRSGDQVGVLTLMVTNRNRAVPVEGVSGQATRLGGVFDHRAVLGPGARLTLMLTPAPGLVPPVPETADEKASWSSDVLQHVDISFELNGRRWTKHANEPAQLAE